MKETSIQNFCEENKISYLSNYINNENLNYCKFEQVFVDTELHSVVTNDFFIFENFERYLNSKKYREKFLSNSNLIQEEIKSSKIINGPSFYIGGENNYWHLLRDFIPKLNILHKERRKMSSFNLLVNSNLTENYFKILKFFLKKLNLDNLRMIKLNYGFFKCNKVIVSARPTMKYSVNFYDKFITNEPYRKNEGKNYYISRYLASKRKIVNENEIIKMLEKYNYNIIYCENLTFEQQIKIFSNAKNIIAPQGAGLTNLFWSQKGINILELSTQVVQPFFHKLADTKGINFFRIVGKDIQPKSYVRPNDRNFLINETLLENVIIKQKIY